MQPLLLTLTKETCILPVSLHDNSISAHIFHQHRRTCVCLSVLVKVNAGIQTVVSSWYGQKWIGMELKKPLCQVRQLVASVAKSSEGVPGSGKAVWGVGRLPYPTPKLPHPSLKLPRLTLRVCFLSHVMNRCAGGTQRCIRSRMLVCVCVHALLKIELSMCV